VEGGFNYNLEYLKKNDGQVKDGTEDLESPDESLSNPERPVKGGFNYNLNYKKKDGGQEEDHSDDLETSDERVENHDAVTKPGYDEDNDDNDDDYGFNHWKAENEGGDKVGGFNYKFDSYLTKDPKSKNDFESWKMSGDDDGADDDDDVDSNDVDNDDQSKILNRFIQNFLKPAWSRSKREDYFAVGSFAYAFDKKQIKNLRQGLEHQTEDQEPPKAAEYHWAPGSVVSASSWVDYREMLIDSLPSKKATKNLALFMFCKLRNFVQKI